ncbi:DUF3808 domain-containing protein [Hymenobacter caeli]|uniref:DUF3808 domain-containing protein n=1 Tax=Hymenobacter caeli TaxID=2735894 RepID=A0ABX2FRG2_9BACT|nr:DUF3808 domain-containing protein [Hymenobacter caeli]NRT19765.1 hypothetical protein [Hymenobacter caeli]
MLRRFRRHALRFSPPPARGLGPLAALWLLTAFVPQGPLNGEATSPEPAVPTADNQLPPASRRAYAEVLKLRLGPARQLLAPELVRAPGAPAPLLVADCADFVELLASQDAARYAQLVPGQQARLDALDDAPAGPWRDYARTEIRLHLGLEHVGFGHQVAGAWQLRRAYQQIQAVAQQYPDFVPARTTLGLGQFAIGTLPQGYHWLLRLLGLPGDVDAGLANLGRAADQPNAFQAESQLFRALIRETYFKQPTEALRLADLLPTQQPDNLLFAYVATAVLKRQHQTAAALAAYRARPVGPAYLPFAYLHHLAGDLLLYQADYAGSERENSQFLREYRGQNYRKDTAFKLYLAAWLGGQPAAAVERYRQQINLAGPTTVEEDAYAQRFYHNALALNPVLTRARLQLDGGYYRPALATLRGFRAGAATPLRDRLEAPYRYARAYQGLGRPDSARLAYAQTLALSNQAPDNAYYFGPQAALELGYLARAAGQRAQARAYFEQALRSPGHEYKNSTDAKAKLALRGL